MSKKILSLLLSLLLIVGAAATPAAAAAGDKIEITLEYNYGTGAISPSPGKLQAEVGKTLTGLTDPTRENYKFIGWFDGATTASSKYQYTAASNVSDNFPRTLYAHWEKKTITVSLYNQIDGNATSSSTPDKTVKLDYGQTFSSVVSQKPSASKTGYTFQYWSDTITGSAFSSNKVVDSTYDADPNEALYAIWNPNQYTVTLNPNGGKLPAIVSNTFTAYYDGKYANMPENNAANNPTLDNYTFDGWYTAASGGTQVIKGTTEFKQTSNQILYAHWTPNDVEVNFNWNFPTGSAFGTTGNDPTPSSPPKQTIKYGDKYGTLPVAPTTLPKYDVSSDKTYTFEGWYTTEKDTIYPDDHDKDVIGKKVTKDSPCKLTPVNNSNPTLTARWGYDINFLSDHTGKLTTVHTEHYTSNTAYGELPPPPDKPGYTFTGWAYEDNNQYHIVTEDSIAVTAYKSLYAQWEPQIITVTLDANLGQFAETDVTFAKIPFGQNYTENLLKVRPTRPGYGFLGWFTQPGSDGKKVTKDTKVDPASDHFLYAHWKGITYTLKLDYNFPSEGIPSPTPKPIPDSTFTYGEKYGAAIPNTTPAAYPSPKPVYTFKNWYTTAADTADVKGVPVNSESIATPEPNPNNTTTLYARWEYEVKFYSNLPGTTNGGALHTTKKLLSGTLLDGQLPDQPKYDAMAFSGWYTAPDDTGTVVDEKTAIADGTTALYAHWGDRECVITLDPGDGTLPEDALTSKKYAYNAVYGDFVDVTPTRNGYVFDGWFDPAGQRVTSASKVTGDYTLTAKWSKNQYTVTLNLNYTGSRNTTVNVEHNSKLVDALPTTPPTRSGYVFEGWHTDEKCTLKVNSNAVVTKSITVYAKWVEGTDIKLDPNGGALPSGSPATVAAYAGGTYPKLPAPTRDGYTFSGWYTHVESGDKVETGGPVAINSVGKPIDTLYARWSVRKVTVYYDYNGAPAGTTTSHTYNYGANHSKLPSHPTWFGREFLGWFTAATGGEEVTHSTPVTATNPNAESLSLTLYAHWGFKIEYDPGSGDGSMETTYAPLNEPYTPPACTFTPPEGMSFDHWAINSLKGPALKAGESYQFTRSAILYAIWSDTPITIASSSNAGGSIATSDGQVGTVTVARGEDVTFIIRPNNGYELRELWIDDEVFTSPFDDYTFQNVTENHTIRAVFQQIGAPAYQTCDRGFHCPLYRYHDLDPKAWYHDAVHFCMDNVIMNGASQSAGIYRPQANITRAELTTALWNAEGRPNPLGSGALVKNYNDVSASDSFYRPVEWATRLGIINGYGNGSFLPRNAITRQELVTILWRHAGRPTARRSTLDKFYDSMAVSGYAVDAMAWATENHVINGRKTGVLDPRGYATRAEVAQMLKNYLG